MRATHEKLPPPVFPAGFTVVEFPTTLELHGQDGKRVCGVPLPYRPHPKGEVLRWLHEAFVTAT